MSFTGFHETWDNLILSLFPNESTEYISHITRIASCLQGGSLTDRLLLAAALAGSTPKVITQSIDTGTWEFAVVAGRHGSIATATNGVVINGASTISIEYSLIANPAANDWKGYTDGSFTGQEVDREIVFVGVINRVVWTPGAAEVLNVMVAI